MLKILQKIRLNQSFGGFYTDCENMSNFAYGRVISCNEKITALCLVSPDGVFDGILALSTDDIIRIEIDGQYSKKMNKLIKNFSVPHEYAVDENDIINSLLSIAKDQGQLISAEIENSGNWNMVGFVKEVSDKVCIEQIDEYGYKDGFSFVKCDGITKLVCNSLDEQRIKRLWEINCKD